MMNHRLIRCVLLIGSTLVTACGAPGAIGDATDDPEETTGIEDRSAFNNSVPMPSIGHPGGGDLQLQAAGNYPVSIGNYGSTLATNKFNLFVILNRLGASKQEKRLLIAVAMGETNTLSASEVDHSKDGSSAANVSIFNENIDMLQRLGYAGNDNGMALNRPENLSVVAAYNLKAIRTWGATRYLNFHRGGSTGFNDGVSYGCASFRNAVATVMARLMNDMDLSRNDDRRVQANVPHV